MVTQLVLVQSLGVQVLLPEPTKRRPSGRRLWFSADPHESSHSFRDAHASFARRSRAVRSKRACDTTSPMPSVLALAVLAAACGGFDRSIETAMAENEPLLVIDLTKRPDHRARRPHFRLSRRSRSCRPRRWLLRSTSGLCRRARAPTRAARAASQVMATRRSTATSPTRSCFPTKATSTPTRPTRCS